MTEDIDYAADNRVSLDAHADDVVKSKVALFLYYTRKLAEAEMSARYHKEKLREVADEQLPDLFAQHGISEYEQDGKVVEIKTIVSAKIKNKASREGALAWLRSVGLGKIIKNSITIFFDKGQDKLVTEYVDFAKEEGLTYEIKDSVHGATLKAAVKDYVAKGNAVDTDALSVYIGRKAVLRGTPEEESSDE